MSAAPPSLLDKLNCNVFGYTFDAVQTIDGDDSHLWALVRSQKDSLTELARRFEPDMPSDFNNVLVKAQTEFCVAAPYTIKYCFL